MPDDPLARLQKRTLVDTALVLPGIRDARTLTNRLRGRLNRAFREGILAKDYAYLIKYRSDTIDIPNIGRQDITVVWGGVEINFKRDPQKAHFKRADDAWFDFHISLRPYNGDLVEHRGSLELLGYGYEIRFPDEIGCGVPWLRFDLNPPNHENDARDIRSHFHPGDDDLQAPAPVMHPEEALEVLLSELLHLPDKRRRRR